MKAGLLEDEKFFTLHPPRPFRISIHQKSFLRNTWLSLSKPEQEMSISRQSNCAVQSFSESEVNQNNKSTYCNYNEAFIGYDEIRQLHGLQCILNIFRQSEVSLEKQIVLEGGFGTGAFLDNIRHHVKKIYGIEGSDEGYQQTKKR